jgi:hypothetical protein
VLFKLQFSDGLLEMIETTTLGTRNERQANSSFDECFATLGEAHNESVYGAVERLVQAGQQVGFTVHDLIHMLKGGMTLESLLHLIEVRMTASFLRHESRAA